MVFSNELFKGTYEKVFEVLDQGKPVFVDTEKDKEVMIKRKFSFLSVSSVKSYEFAYIQNGVRTVSHVVTLTQAQIYVKRAKPDSFRYKSKFKGFEQHSVVFVDFKNKKVLDNY